MITNILQKFYSYPTQGNRILAVRMNLGMGILSNLTRPHTGFTFLRSSLGTRGGKFALGTAVPSAFGLFSDDLALLD